MIRTGSVLVCDSRVIQLLLKLTKQLLEVRVRVLGHAGSLVVAPGLNHRLAMGTNVLQLVVVS